MKEVDVQPLDSFPCCLVSAWRSLPAPTIHHEGFHTSWYNAFEIVERVPLVGRANKSFLLSHLREHQDGYRRRSKERRASSIPLRVCSQSVYLRVFVRPSDNINLDVGKALLGVAKERSPKPDLSAQFSDVSLEKRTRHGAPSMRRRSSLTTVIPGPLSFVLDSLPMSCKLQGCLRPARQTKDYCQMHHLRVWRNGDPGSVESKRWKYLGKKCTYEGCTADAKVSSLCRAHYSKGYHRTYQQQHSTEIKYGITQQDYEALYRKQRGRCAICRTVEKLV
jgi:hypothetical protein